jgi:predicted phosphoribosyltransferase
VRHLACTLTSMASTTSRRRVADELHPYEDRRHAGVELVEHSRAEATSVILALPRRGVRVAYEVVLALNAPLDVFLVGKLGVPTHPEWAMGPIASGGSAF